MSQKVLVNGPAIDTVGDNGVEGGTGFLIGDGLILTAGHIVFEYNHSHDADPTLITTADIVTTNAAVNDRVESDYLHYQDAYAPAVAASYQSGSPASNSVIEVSLIAHDSVVIRGSGTVSKDNFGLVAFVDRADLANIAGDLSGNFTITRDGANTGPTQGNITAFSNGYLTYDQDANTDHTPNTPGDSGAAILLNYGQKSFVLGTQSAASLSLHVSYATALTIANVQQLSELAVANKTGNVSNTEPTNLLVGPATADSTIQGTFRPDIIIGGAGNDTIDGGDLVGSKAWGNDQLYGGAGDDTLVGGLGSNLLHGGNRLDAASTDAQLAMDGNDTADYSKLLGSATHGIKIDVTDTPVDQTYKDNLDFKHAVFVTDLANPHNGTKDVDTLISIETIKGTARDDVLSISNLDEVFLANKDGVGGLNKVDFGAHDKGDVIDLTNMSESAMAHFDGSDHYITGLNSTTPKLHFTDAQLIFASSHGDTIVAGAGDMTIVGGAGNDHITAGTGNDLIFGGPGDNVIAGSGNDKIVIAAGTPSSPPVTITTGSGVDSIWLSAALLPPVSPSPGEIFSIGPQGETYTVKEQGTLNPGDQIYWNGYQLQGGKFEVLNEPERGEVSFPGSAGWVDSHGVVYNYDDISSSLSIILPDYSRINISNFHNGDFGMSFNPSVPVGHWDGVPRANIANSGTPGYIVDSNLFMQLTGHAEALSTSGSSIAPAQPDLKSFTEPAAAAPAVSITGDGRDLVAATDQSIIVTGRSDTVIVTGSNTRVKIGGNGQYASDTDDNHLNYKDGVGGIATVLDNSRVDVVGANIDVFAGTNETIGLQGAGNTLTATGSGVALWVGGNGQYVADENDIHTTFAQGGVITVLDNSRVEMSGDSLIATLGSYDTVGLFGHGEKLSAVGLGNAIWVGGNGQFASDLDDNHLTLAQGGIVTVLDQSRLELSGDAVIASAGNNDTLGLFGRGNTLTVSGTGTAVWVGGNGQAAADGDVNNVSFAEGGNAVVTDGARISMRGSSVAVQAGSDDDVTLVGSADRITMSGTGSIVRLTEGSDNCQLIAGPGSDTFAFSGSFGHDLIQDFNPTGTSHDTLMFDRHVFASIAAVLQASTQMGADVVITSGPNDVLRLQNVSLAALDGNNLHIT